MEKKMTMRRLEREKYDSAEEEKNVTVRNKMWRNTMSFPLPKNDGEDSFLHFLYFLHFIMLRSNEPETILFSCFSRFFAV
jgi:hypothetical protein